MKIRVIKKAIKAIAEGRRTPLMKKVTLDNVSFFQYNKDHEQHQLPSLPR